MPYVSYTAPVACFSRRAASRACAKLAFDGLGWGMVRTMRGWKWPPQQIATPLKRVFPDDPNAMSRSRPFTWPSTPSRAESCASNSWAACAMCGVLGNKSSMGVLLERTCRLVLLARMDDATAASALAGQSAKLNSIAAPLRSSFTYKGTELPLHVELAAHTGVKVYFCDPYSPWQRGTCENINGLIRQYLPKGTGLSVFGQAELDGSASSLNTRPRATHDWHTPLEVFAQTLASSHKVSTSVQLAGCCASDLKPPGVNLGLW